MLGVRVGPLGFAPGSAAQSRVEMVFRLFSGKERKRGRHCVPCVCPFGCLDGRHIVTGEEARLKLADPVKTFQKRARGLFRDALLEGALRECTIVQGAEFRGFSAQCSSERDRRRKSVEKKSIPLHEGQLFFSLALEFLQWMA